MAAHDVVKHYGQVHAVDGVNFTVTPGEIYALLGLNGAGKTTTIRVLLSMIKPTSGTVTLFGERVTPGATHLWSQVGYLVETPTAYPELTVRQNLAVAARLKHLPAAAADEAVERLGLRPYADRRSRDLSLGNRQRLGLAKALLGQPGLLILDEPANGLDPAGVTEVRQLLKDLAAGGTAILLSSHILAEVAKLATRIGIIHHGKMITEMAAADLALHARRRLEVACRDLHAAVRILGEAGYSPQTSGRLLTLMAADAVESPDRIATVLVEGGCPPTHLTVREDDLETVFLRLTGQETSR
ncbi:ABC transporter ATP-binding protein [Micromonospora sp. NBC_00898]|uniref:ABC transporter ATP-binding protein n=1 Tax=Micromonospora sp. NBC_00898 TaxID=2975981 RepID=UPI00386CDD35|nr:ABC transporter ATP-binding protein [Micromonospora sp. NBC_00898]